MTGVQTCALPISSAEVAAQTSILDVLVSSGLANSKGEARRFVGDKAVRLNGIVVNEKKIFAPDDFKKGIAILKRGTRNVAVLVQK